MKSRSVPEGSSSGSLPRLRRLSRQGLVVLGLGVLLYGLLAVWSGLDDLSAALRRLPGRTLVVMLALVLLGWLLRAVRWHAYTRRLGLGLPLVPNLLAFLASFAFTATPGKAGEVVKSLLLKLRFGTPVTVTAGALVAERLVDLMAVLLLALGGLTRSDARIYLVSSAVLLAAMTLFLLNERLHRGLLDWLRRLPVVGPAADPLARLFAAGRTLLAPGPLALGLSLAVIAWGCEGTALYLLLRALGHPISLASSYAVFGLATLVGALSMLPGGLGGFEATMLLLLSGAGVARGEAVAATLVLRVATLWWITGLGVLFLGLWWVLERGRDAGSDGESVTAPNPRSEVG